MSKDLAFDLSETEVLENPAIFIEEEQPNEYIELLQKLQKKEVVLSYSSLKAFAKSPRNFIQYKLKPKTQQTESQILGSLCDCFLTTPKDFDKLFVIVDSFPTSDNQKGFCEDMINGKSAEDAYANNYKVGGVDKVYSAMQGYINAIKSGKMVCSTKMKEEAEKIIDNLKKSELVMQFIDSCDTFQTKSEWSYEGWKFIGFKDATGKNLIIDFKFTKDADPDKFERDIVNYDYFMQMGMYADTEEGIPECYFIVYDRSMNFSVIKVDYSFLNYGIRKYKYLVAKLNQCIKENRFLESYNFFDVQLRTVYKPKWIKGFETDPMDVE